MNWPTLSITIPTYNGADYLEGAIQSVIEQDYPALDLSVVDGGSTDGSVDIIKSYADHLSWWVSERDSGQSEAINKGFNKATGEIFNWLCCDDRLEAGALHEVGRRFAENPNLDLMAGKCQLVHLDSGDPPSYWVPTEERIQAMPILNPFPQPSCFFKRNLVKRPDLVKNDYHYSMDYELWNYLFTTNENIQYELTDKSLSIYQITGENKTSVGGIKTINELDRIYREYAGERLPLSRIYRYTRMPLDRINDTPSSPPWLKKLVYPVWRINSAILNRCYSPDKVHAISNEWRTFYLK